jgi:hypothetical protein
MPQKNATNLKGNGWTIIIPPKVFFVNGKKGLLKMENLSLAADWARDIVKSTSVLDKNFGRGRIII